MVTEQLNAFFQKELWPALYGRLPEAFPDFGWKRETDHYSNSAAPRLRLPGTETPRAGRVCVYENNPGVIIVHGTAEKPWNWIQFLTQDDHPRGEAFKRAVSDLCAQAGISSPFARPQQDAGQWTRPTPADLNRTITAEDAYLRRHVSSLGRETAAMEWLTKQRGYSPTVVRRFHLGLERGGAKSKANNALIFPRMNDEGQITRHYFHYPVPGLTTFNKPRDETAGSWGFKSDLPYFYFSGAAAGKSEILICEGFKDLWAVATLLEQDINLQQTLLVVTATHGAGQTPKCIAAIPTDWWQRFQTIFIGLDDDKTGRAAIDASVRALNSFGCEVKWARVPPHVATVKDKRADWNDLLLKGSLSDFRSTLSNASVYAVPSDVPNKDSNGNALSYDEVDPNVLFHRGYYYWPFERPEWREDPELGRLEEFQIRVLRSDGVILDIVSSKTITQFGRRIRRLSDGTPISRLPRPVSNAKSSLDWRTVNAYVEARTRGRMLPTPPLAELLNKIRLHLKATIWLPDEENYALMALGAFTSYAQEIFQAVPLFFSHGPAGSGKTQLAAEVSSLGCNGRALGRTTLAGLMDTADRTRGLVCVDDLEEMAPSRGRNAGIINPLQQIIKQSYEKTGAHHTRIGEDGDLAERNFYGVKLINNTQGIDTITSTRMFTIHMRRRTEQALAEMLGLQEHKLTVLAKRRLRNQCHIWVFSNVDEINRVYQGLLPKCIERSDEISAPLRTLAEISGDETIKAHLEVAIQRREGAVPAVEDAALLEAMDACIARGQTSVAAHQIINEVIRILGADWDCTNRQEIQLWMQPKWVTEKMHIEGWIERKHASRPRVPHNESSVKRLTAYEWNQKFLAERIAALKAVGKEIPSSPDANSFCLGCAKCEYADNCVIRVTCGGVSRPSTKQTKDSNMHVLTRFPKSVKQAS
jgi:hypothetical protein